MKKARRIWSSQPTEEEITEAEYKVEEIKVNSVPLKAKKKK